MKAFEPTITDPTGAPNPFDRHTCTLAFIREIQSHILRCVIAHSYLFFGKGHFQFHQGLFGNCNPGGSRPFPGENFPLVRRLGIKSRGFTPVSSDSRPGLFFRGYLTRTAKQALIWFFFLSLLDDHFVSTASSSTASCPYSRVRSFSWKHPRGYCNEQRGGKTKKKRT